jgi:Flp pilus assembly protein TadD
MSMRAIPVALAMMLLACGEPPKPPETPPPSLDNGPSSTPAPKSSGSSSGTSGPVAPTNSDDVKKGIAALKSGDLPGAKAAFDAAIAKNPKQADAYHYRGVVEDQAGQKAEAEKDYRKALEIQPDLEESAVNLAALDIEGGKYDEAATLMKKAIAKNPKSAALHVNLAMALAGKNDADGAGKELDEALKLEPNNALTAVTYAQILARAGKAKDAAAKLEQAARLAASDPGVLASVAIEYKNMKDFKSCISTLDKAIGIKDVAELRVYRGTCKLGLHDLPGATAEFKDAVAKEPNNPVAHYSLGNALGDGGKLAEAIAEWEQAVKLAPDTQMAKSAEKKIEIAKKKKK